MKTIAVFNAKGGVGKSSLALALAQVLDLQILTNDVCNPYNLALESDRYFLIPKGQAIPRFTESVIYDFGGFGDKRILDFIQREKGLVTLIPFNGDLASWQVALSVYAEIKAHSHRIIFVLNRARKGDYDVFHKQMERLKIDASLVEIPESRLFQNLFNNGAQIAEIKESKLFSYTYRKALEALEHLIKEIEQ